MTKQVNTSTLRWMIAGVVFLATIVGLVAWHTSQAYPDTSNPTAAVQKMTDQNNDYVIVFHRTGCAACESVKKQVVSSLKASNQRYVVVNAAHSDSQTKDLMTKFDIEHTPTFVHMRGNKFVASYTGTDLTEINKLLNVIQK
ncbi:thioredoxin family protein [Weissella confusa]|uniref:thioredoxin family protein n=1 Tax=Weissella confusa TaxID=1583 RepID=UPI001C6F7153|nr:thioredoxin family protein [Weissella confusa]QYU57996.1 thioredoxin family protein [Weissella confusa]